MTPFLTRSVSLNLGFGAYHLLSGLLLGVVKYVQIHNSTTATAHPYISTAHRAALMYGFASAQLAGAALLSAWPESVNVAATIATQIFFVTAVGSYAVHGILRDTTNQLKQPHKLGPKHAMPPWLIRLYMALLVTSEVVGCGVLTAGMCSTLFKASNASTL
ncbi:hypothetical protein BGZ94_007827 [Podila epigama]|nr:hypothetical protein BGZ94_007827 [Podila epigama]